MRIPRTHRRLAPLVGALVAVMLMAAAPARAEDVGHRIIRLCAEGKSLAGFPPGDYAKALKEISATTEEYSECGQLIRAAQASAASTRGAAAVAPSSAALPLAIAATPAEQQSIAGAAARGGGPVDLGGQEIHPGVVHADIASALSALPTPLLALLAFLLAFLLLFAARFLRNRIRDERAD